MATPSIPQHGVNATCGDCEGSGYRLDTGDECVTCLGSGYTRSYEVGKALRDSLAQCRTPLELVGAARRHGEACEQYEAMLRRMHRHQDADVVAAEGGAYLAIASAMQAVLERLAAPPPGGWADVLTRRLTRGRGA